ncbi:hypothetical protein ACFLTK_02785 [Chloroflexota bacterium]
MITTCKKCGASVVVNTGGRKKLAIDVTLLCDTLRLQRSIPAAAQELACSRGYIYKVLKNNKLTLKDVMSDKGEEVGIS